MKKKKSLGQHFLHNAHYLRLIVGTADIKKGESVLEIGPGDGALTKELLASRCKVLAIEKDRRLIPLLSEKFSQEISAGQLTLIEGDALEFDPSDHNLEARNWKLVANIPYYITGALLKKFLSAEAQPSLMVLLVQKEVAERVSRSKKESVLSLSVKAYGEPTYVKTVPRGAFTPSPSVDSAVLRISGISKKHFKNAAQEKKFFELVKKGFSSKRKFLLNNLGKNYSGILKNNGIGEKVRAEDLSLAEWLQLAAQ
jgi:16S rRNA (adenine1518-N6/adenine1519-N6)-dimethyltransferase